MLSTIIAFLVGIWGAILSFFRRDISTYSILKTTSTLFVDMLVNVGLTMLAYLGLIGYGINDLMSVAIAGAIGHQGTRSYFLVELIIAEKLGAKATFQEIKNDHEK